MTFLEFSGVIRDVLLYLSDDEIKRTIKERKCRENCLFQALLEKVQQDENKFLYTYSIILYFTRLKADYFYLAVCLHRKSGRFAHSESRSMRTWLKYGSSAWCNSICIINKCILIKLSKRKPHMLAMKA